MAANPSIQLGTDGNWAIKEDNLLAYKKDGTRFFNKEFDFTRGSLATFVDKDGLIKVSGVTNTKLVVNGDFATNLNGWTNSNNHWQWTSQGAYFPETTTHNPLSQTLVNDANVILKFTFTLNIIKGTVNVTYEDSTNASIQTQYTTSGTYTIYTTPVEANTTIYFSRYGGINTEFYLNNVSAFEIQTDVPRIDFTDDTTGHLLLEPQSTNLFTYSEDFSQSAWFTSGWTLTSGLLAPNGSLDAYSVLRTTGTTFAQSKTLLSNTTYTFSAYIKNVNATNIQLRVQNQAGNTSGTESNCIVFSVTDQTNDSNFTRITHTFNTGDAGTYGLFLGYYSAGEYIVWGAQLEEGSYATSYIPTYGSTATRNGEVCNNSGSEQDFNDSEGVLYVEMSALNNGGIQTGVRLQNDSEDSVLTIYYNLAANYLTPRLYKSNSSIWARDIVIGDQTVNNKFALRYNSNGADIFINGLKNNCSSLNSSFTNGTITNFSFIGSNGSGNPLYGKTKNLKVFKRAMSDGELYLLTVPQYQSYQEMATALNYTL